MTAVSSLPEELITLIASNLALNDLSCSVRVCKEWQAAFTPSLWREIRIVDETIDERFTSEEARMALVDNSHYIRVVETSDPTFMFYLATTEPKITKLQSITLRLRKNRTSPLSTILYSKKHVPAPIPAAIGPDNSIHLPRCGTYILELVNNNKDVRELSFDDGCYRLKDGRDCFPHLIATLPTSVEKLELSFLDPIDENDPKRGDDGVYLRKVGGLFRSLDPLHALKEVRINAVDKQRMDSRQLIFLERCPNIEKLWIDHPDNGLVRNLPLFLRACLNLNRLEWPTCDMVSKDYIIGLLRSSTLGWKELRLPDLVQFGAQAMEVVLENVDTLEIFRLESTEYLDVHKATLDLLCSAKNLRRLEGLADGQRSFTIRELELNAYEAYLEHIGGTRGDRSWALGPSMEYLQLQIDWIPRPDVMYRQSGQRLFFRQVQMNNDLRFQVQRWVYAQLGRMTGLKELILGFADLTDAILETYGLDYSMNPAVMEETLLRNIRMFRYMSLEFSLESGLALLAGLKELRVLDVRAMAHYIGVEELEWMHINWPKLKTIRGLESDRRWSVKYEEGPAARAAVQAWMAAHPKGIGSSYY
ncbi:hypothetical protein FBU30_008417 [Linnemannia zychae]|nr:hypothetical protein FBU30_008417 [Linnemannia zychae]